MEKERDIQIQIGHIGHDIAIELITRQILAEKGMNDVIVVDESNIVQIRQQLANTDRHSLRPIEKLSIPELKMIETEEFYGAPAGKHRKPNKGIKLGSYTFKSHKKF